MLIFGTNIDIVNATKSFLTSSFEMKDLGETYVILGIKITRTTYGMYLNHYTRPDIAYVVRYNFAHSKLIPHTKTKRSDVSCYQYYLLLAGHKNKKEPIM